MLYILLHKNKIAGVFSDLKKCKIIMKGLVTNGFTTMKMLQIVTYYENSITLFDDKVEEAPKEDNIIEMFTDEDTTSTENDTKKTPKKTPKKTLKKPEKKVLTEELDSDTKNKINKQRLKQNKIEYNMSLLKQKKEKLEESKTIFNADLTLFNKFKKILVSKPSFVIPELFLQKFNTMLRLESENNLNWESFNNIYEKETIDTSYNKLFGVEKCKEKQLLEISSEEK
jgi:hypothetical protein